MSWFDVAGWLGALLTAAAYSMKDMKCLRRVAVGANLSFITYGMAAGVWPMLALHLFLLPLNLFRLIELLLAGGRNVGMPAVNRASEQTAPEDTLMAFAPGQVIFRRGDALDHVYLLEEGEIELPELGITLGKGALFGEMALFARGKSRTATAICRTPCRVVALDEAGFMRMFGLHADFGVYVLRLIAERLVDGSRTRPDLYNDFAARDLPSGLHH